MNREIKFRFLREDGDYEKSIAMINGKPYRETQPLNNDYITVFKDKRATDYYRDWAKYEPAENIIAIEQYTGLKDKNGVEIYEGDIVKLNDTSIHEIKWFGEDDYPAFDLWPSIDVESNGLCYCAVAADQALEIIGNIHGNPELIK